MTALGGTVEEERTGEIMVLRELEPMATDGNPEGTARRFHAWGHLLQATQ